MTMKEVKQFIHYNMCLSTVGLLCCDGDQPSPWFSWPNSLLCIDVRSPHQTIMSYDHDRALFHPEYIEQLKSYPDPRMSKKS